MKGVYLLLKPILTWDMCLGEIVYDDFNRYLSKSNLIENKY